jgi:hypothetical protein
MSQGLILTDAPSSAYWEKSEKKRKKERKEKWLAPFFPGLDLDTLCLQCLGRVFMVVRCN